MHIFYPNSSLDGVRLNFIINRDQISMQYVFILRSKIMFSNYKIQLTDQRIQKRKLLFYIFMAFYVIRACVM